MNIQDMMDESHATSISKGFFDDGEPVDIDRKLLMAVGELVEAQNELREGHPPDFIYVQHPNGHVYPWREGDKPEGFVIELADAVIRIGQLAKLLNIDLPGAIRVKLDYNKTRSFKHGKQF